MLQMQLSIITIVTVIPLLLLKLSLRERERERILKLSYCNNTAMHSTIILFTKRQIQSDEEMTNISRIFFFNESVHESLAAFAGRWRQFNHQLSLSLPRDVVGIQCLHCPDKR